MWVNGYPKFIELLSLWQILWTKNDIFVDTVQLYFGILGILTVYSLAVKIGIKKKWAMTAGFLFFLTPTLLLQAKTGYIDVSVATLVLMSFNFLACAYKNQNYLIFSGLSAGLLIGSKPSGLLFMVNIYSIFIMAANLFSVFLLEKIYYRLLEKNVNCYCYYFYIRWFLVYEKLLLL